MTGSAPARRALVGEIPGAQAARVRMSIYPLEADAEQLQELCDAWFNSKLPPELSFFRPAFPVVFCSVLHYEDMGDAFQSRTGILAQDEIYFLVPLERYRWLDGRLQFIELGAFTPYIFVDSPESVSYGREHFGFPKELCAFRPGGPDSEVPWEVSGQDLLTVDTWQPTPHGTQLRPLLTISRFPRTRLDGFDLPRRGVLGPLGTNRRSQLLWWLQNLATEVRRRRALGLGPAPALPPGRWVDLLLQSPTVSCYNLRQAPHPHDLRWTAYRDLVNVRLQTRAVTGLRLFRELGSGLDGVTITIRRVGVLPIVERLGLRVRRRRQFRGESGDEVADAVDAIVPALVQTDFVLDTSERVAWQFEGGPWKSPGRERRVRRPEKAPRPPRLDEYIGVSSTLLALSRDSDRPTPAHDLKFMLLAADAEKLQRLVDHLFGIRGAPPLTVQRVGQHAPVRLLWRSSRQEKPDEIDGIAWSGGRYLSISTLVRFEHDEKSQEALLLLNDFADNPFGIQLSRGLFAKEMHYARFHDVEGGWFGSTREVVRHQLLETTLMRRHRVETRFEMMPWMEVVSSRRSQDLERPVVGAELVDAFRERLFDILPLLQVGGITDSADPGQWVERRCTRTEYRVRWEKPLRSLPPDPRYWLLFRRNQTFPFVREMGLVTDDVELPAPSDLTGWSIARLPALAVAEAAVHTELTPVRMLWSRRGRQPRRFAGLGVNSPRGGDLR